MTNAISRRLSRIEAQQALKEAPSSSRFFYNILDKHGISYDNYLLAGPKYCNLRPATPEEILELKKQSYN